MITTQDILAQICQREAEFEKTAEISLLGHSLFDLWQHTEDYSHHFAGKILANLGFSAITARQYLDWIVESGKITQLGKKVFIFLGVNDIVREPDYSPQEVANWLEILVQKLKEIAPHSQYFLLEATPVRWRDNLDNQPIQQLNRYLKSHCPIGVTWIETYTAFCDENGLLAQELTTDGLHFSAQGYALLARLLQPYWQ